MKTVRFDPGAGSPHGIFALTPNHCAFTASRAWVQYQWLPDDLVRMQAANPFETGANLVVSLGDRGLNIWNVARIVTLRSL